MCEYDKFYTDKEEEERLEKNKNPIKQDFISIQDNILELHCMLDILLTALDNEIKWIDPVGNQTFCTKSIDFGKSSQTSSG